LTGRIEATAMLAYLVDLVLGAKPVESPSAEVGTGLAGTPQAEA
jgi:hypothetical protein